MAKEKTAFKVLWREFLKLVRLLESHSRSARTQVRATKRTAYQLAKMVIAMQCEHHNEYYRMVKSGSEDPEQTRLRIFAPLEAIRESTGQLFKWIDEGVTLKQYLDTPAVLFKTKVGKKKGAAEPAADRPSFERQTQGMDPQVLCREQAGHIKTLECDIRELKKQTRRLLHDNAVQAKELSRLHIRLGRQLVA